MFVKLTPTKLISINFTRTFLKRRQKIRGRLNWLQTTSCFSTSASPQADKLDKKPFYVTTPIFYVNASPHIGHLYTALVADSLSRWKKLKGYQTFFATGTDEHGLKIQQAAGKAGIAPQVFCDDISNKFKDLFVKNDINYSSFIRTTDEAHIKAVHHLWNVLNEKGFIYKSVYKGWYSVSDETFVSEKDITEVTTKSGELQKVSVESGHPVIWSEEENYMFTLSQFKPQLQQWIDKDVIQPPEFKKVVQAYLDDLSDLSVTRSSERVSWGISVPNDPSQKIYVWLDALTNYLTVTGYPSNEFEYQNLWPADCHVVGKDIIKFHAVYWPAFLLAAGLSLPKKILCHSHWKVDGVKMSKSLGNIVDPFDCMHKYTVDGLRYFLLRQAIPQNDADFSETKIVDVINSELVNTIGNALSRISGKVVNPSQVFPNPSADALRTKFTPEDRQRLERLYGLADEVDGFYEEGNMYFVMQTLMDYIFWANKLIQDHEPWVLVKSESEKDHLETLIYIAMETLRVCGILVQPIVPDFSSRLLNRLGVPDTERDIVHSKVKVQPASSDYVQILNPMKSVLLKRLK